MKYSELLENVIKTLPFDTPHFILKSGGIEVFILRPSTPPKRFTGYDINKNFQIWFREGKREFKPNHLRVMIDLYLRSRSRKDLKKELLFAFDSIFYGGDPLVAIKPLKKEKFEHFLNPLIISATFAQLFIAEQEYGYPRKSNYDPSSLFFQGWIRQVIADNKEIDNLIMSIAKGNPPRPIYTNFENKKHKSYNPKLPPLWYFEESVK